MALSHVRVTLNGVLGIRFIDHFNTELVMTIIAPSLISTLYNSLEHTISLFRSAVSSLVVSW
jgi:hypothetical protein